MSEQPVKLAVIIGSVRDGRFGPVMAKWFARQAEQYDAVAVDVIDLLDFPLPVHMPVPGQQLDPAVAEIRDPLAARLFAAEAFVVVTPEYNHSVPAGLKNAIDWFLEEWMAKPVALISYGGMGGGLRAAEHLRQVFSEVHAVTVREMISFHNAWAEFGMPGQPASPEGSVAAAKKLIDQIVWWGRALRDARERTPYTR